MPFIGIRDNSHPHVVFDPNTVPMAWNTGHLHEISLSSQFMRITTRGMHYASFHNPNSWIFHDHEPLDPWHTHSCQAVPGALCEESTELSSMQYFPLGTVDLPDDMQAQFAGSQQAYVNFVMANNATCTNSKSGRIIKPYDSRYEVSLCDLLDNNLDIVWDPQAQKVFWRLDQTSMFMYIIISVLGIYLVSCLAENIRSILSQDKTAQTKTRLSWVYNFMLGFTLAFIMYDQLTASTTEFMLFTYEKNTHFLLSFFVYVSAVGYFVDWWRRRQFGPEHNHSRAVRCVSLLTVSLILLTARIHYTFDNPYTWILTTIFGVRSMHKFLNRITSPLSDLEEHDDHHHTAHSGPVVPLPTNNLPWKLFKHSLQLFDAVVFISMMTHAVLPGYDLPPNANAMVFLILVISLLSGTIIARHTLH
tara:strand:- start:12879 stop:14132 length:1254 start_codon:yes stop_codon:yes gene_type:complete